MRLIRLELNNIRQFEKEEIFFPKSGLIGIVGRNGGGKSTIVNTIEWILHGKYEDLKNEDLRSKLADNKTPVSGVLDFYFKNSYYRIKRSLSSSDKQNFVQQNGRVVASGTRNMEDYIRNDLLKMDYKTFQACFYAAQDDFDALAKMSSAPRIALLTKLLNLDAIDKASSANKKQKDALEAEINLLKNQIIDTTIVTNRINDLGLILDTEQRSLSQYSEELAALVNELKDIALTVTKNEETFKKHLQISSFQQSTKQKISFMKSNIEKIQMKISKIEILKKELNSLAPEKELYLELITQKDILNDKKEIYALLFNLKKHSNELLQQKEQLLNQISYLKSESDDFTTRRNSLSYIETKLTEHQALLQEKEKMLFEINFKISDLEAKISAQKKISSNFDYINAEIPCPTCSQIMSEEHKQREIEKLTKELERLNSELSVLFRKKEEQSKSLVSAREEMTKLNYTSQEFIQLSNQLNINGANLNNALKHLSNIETSLERNEKEILAQPDVSDFNPEEYKQLLSKINQVKPLYDKYNHIAIEIKNEENIKLELEECEINLKEGEYVLNQINEKLKELDFDEEAHKKSKQTFENLNNLRLELLESINERKLKINSMNSEREHLQKRLEEYSKHDEEIKSKEWEVINLRKLNLLYKGYKVYKLAKLAPELSVIISRLLTIATDGLLNKVVLDENDFSIKVYNNDTLMNFNSFSGAQRKIISICQRIGISQVLSSINNNHLDLMIFDEAFGSLDNENQDSVVQLFKKLHKIFPQIIVIAHNDYLKEQFEHTLSMTVTMKGDNRISKSEWIKSANGEDTFELEELKKEIYDNYSTI